VRPKRLDASCSPSSSRRGVPSQLAREARRDRRWCAAADRDVRRSPARARATTARAAAELRRDVRAQVARIHAATYGKYLIETTVRPRRRVGRAERRVALRSHARGRRRAVRRRLAERAQPRRAAADRGRARWWRARGRPRERRVVARWPRSANLVHGRCAPARSGSVAATKSFLLAGVAFSPARRRRGPMTPRSTTPSRAAPMQLCGRRRPRLGYRGRAARPAIEPLRPRGRLLGLGAALRRSLAH